MRALQSPRLLLPNLPLLRGVCRLACRLPESDSQSHAPRVASLCALHERPRRRGAATDCGLEAPSSPYRSHFGPVRVYEGSMGLSAPGVKRKEPVGKITKKDLSKWSPKRRVCSSQPWQPSFSFLCRCCSAPDRFVFALYLNNLHAGCIVKGENQKSPLFRRSSMGV